MSFQKFRKKFEYYPELLSIILFFALMMIQPVSEQYLYKVYSDKYNISYNYAGSKSGCPDSNGTEGNITSLTKKVSTICALYSK